MAIRWVDKLTILDNGDIIDFNGQVVGHIDVDLIDFEDIGFVIKTGQTIRDSDITEFELYQ